MSSAASIFQRLSIGESKQKVPTFEDDPAVVIPIHLQALGADCSHLSFVTLMALVLHLLSFLILIIFQK